MVISRSEKFIDPTHIVPPDTPIVLCEQFNCYHVCLNVENVNMDPEAMQSSGSRNLYDVLMASSTESYPKCWNLWKARNCAVINGCTMIF